jgi:hypothetical protein
MRSVGCGIDLSGLHIGYASCGESDYSCREPGVLGPPIKEGATLRWGENALLNLENLLNPENVIASRQNQDGFAFLPVWSLWKTLSSTKYWNSVSQKCEPQMIVQIIEQLLAKNKAGKSLRALVVDDDLPFSLQERFAQFFRVKGIEIVLLPRTVALFLAWAESIAPGEKRKWGGKSCVIINLKVNELIATEIEMAWVDKDWAEKKNEPNSVEGFLIPSIKKQSTRVVSKYEYLPLDVDQLRGLNFADLPREADLLHSWKSLIKERFKPIERHAEFPDLAFGDSGWVKFSKSNQLKHLDEIQLFWNMVCGGGELKMPACFDSQKLSEKFKQIQDDCNPSKVIIVDETYGLLKHDFKSEAKKHFDLLPDFTAQHSEKGAAIFAARLANNLPTYYEELPDLKILAPVGKSRKREPISLVDTETDYARGGKIYQKEPYVAYLKPKESLSLNLWVEGEKKHAECSFFETPDEEVKVTLKVEVTASQGYGKIQFVPLEEEVLRKYGSISVDWENLKDGHVEVEEEYNCPPVSHIKPDGMGFGLWTNQMGFEEENELIVGSIKALMSGDFNNLKEKEKLLEQVHKGCRNGVALGSDWKTGADILIKDKVLDADFPDTWKDFRLFIESELDKENNYGSKLTQRLIQVGSHFWRQTPQNIKEDLAFLLPKDLDQWVTVSFIEAAGRAFHEETEINIFIECFLKEVSENKTRVRENWFKALSFIFRTNEKITEFVDFNSFESITNAVTERLSFEFSKLGKQLKRPFRYCLLLSLYLLRMRDSSFGGDLFDLSSDRIEGSADVKLAKLLMSCCLNSWLVQPWIPVGSFLGEIQKPSPNLDKVFTAIFLWPEEKPSLTFDEVDNRIKMLKEINFLDNDFNDTQAISSFDSHGFIIDKNDHFVVGELSSDYELFRGEKAKSALQPSIARFLLGRAGGSDIRLVETGADEVA